MTQEQANMHYVIYTSSPNTEQGFGPDHTQTFNDKCESYLKFTKCVSIASLKNLNTSNLFTFSRPRI